MPTPTSAHGQQYFLVNSDQLAELILQFSPEIRRDTNRMADLISASVELEREKRGLDKSGGQGTLMLNPYRARSPKAPDFSGVLSISGKTYQCSAYVGKNQEFINLTFK